MWRFREVLSLLILYFFWTAIYDKRELLFGYSQIQMVTYILTSTVIQNFVMATRTQEVADEIESGHVINFILKPFSFFTFQVTRDVADKSINVIFGVIEIAALIFLFKPALIFQHDLLTLLIILLMAILGSFIGFFINLIFSFLAFWTTETWAPSFIFTILVSFLAGGYFPLDILPKPLYNLLLLTPFPYLYYLPAKTYISGLNSFSLLGVVVCAAWVGIFYFLAKLMWNKGLKNYSFFGQ
jgi:ABC-2 type transport system permease protein